MPNWFAGEDSNDFTGMVTALECVEGKFGPQAVLTVQLDTPITKNDGTLMNEKPIYYGLPQGWVEKDGRLMSPSGDPDKMLPKDNKFQRAIAAAGETSPSARAYLTRDNLSPYHLAAWTGARFHFMTIGAGDSYTMEDRETGEKVSGKTKGFPAPTEWLGTKDNPIGGSVGATVSSSVDAASVLAEVGLDSETFDALTGLARNETPDKFVTDAMAHREGAGNAQAFIKHLGSGALYQALREE